MLKRRRDPAAVNSRLIRRPIQRMFWLFLLPMTGAFWHWQNKCGIRERDLTLPGSTKTSFNEKNGSNKWDSNSDRP